MDADDTEHTEYDANSDDAYDERSKGEALRESEEQVELMDGSHVGKITGYSFHIRIKNEADLVGTLTRDEMDMIGEDFVLLKKEGDSWALAGTREDYWIEDENEFKKALLHRAALEFMGDQCS